jgi:integrase
MSVRKRTWTTSKGVTKEAWIADYVDQSGKRHIETFKRKKDADAFSDTVGVEVREGTHSAKSGSITVADAGKLWLETGVQDGLERATLSQYRQHLDLHINPYLGRLKLAQLNAPMIRDFEGALLRGDPAPGESEGRPRSKALMRKVLVSLGSLLGDAQERGKVGRNVVRELRRRRKSGKERQGERRQRGKLKIGLDIPTREEIKTLIAALEGRWRLILLTAIFTGLRASELRGLRWADVDFKRSELHVRQRADRYSAIGAPKSESGERTGPLTPIVANTLMEWKLVCPKGEHDLVFPTSGGKIEHHKNIVERGLIPAMIAAGVTVPAPHREGNPKHDEDRKPIIAAKYTGLHALRHFYASWCINRRQDGGLELPPKVVQERLGHSSITMTMDVYGHLFPRGDDSAELAEAERSLIA